MCMTTSSSASGRRVSQQEDYVDMDAKQLAGMLNKAFTTSSDIRFKDEPRIEDRQRTSNSKSIRPSKSARSERRQASLTWCSMSPRHSSRKYNLSEEKSSDPNLARYLDMDEERLKNLLKEKKPALRLEDVISSSGHKTSIKKKKSTGVKSSSKTKKATKKVPKDSDGRIGSKNKDNDLPPSSSEKGSWQVDRISGKYKDDDSIGTSSAASKSFSSLRNFMADALKVSKTSSDVAKHLLLKAEQQKNEDKRQTEKLFKEALRVGKKNVEVAALLIRADRGKPMLKPVEESTDESSGASTIHSIKEDNVLLAQAKPLSVAPNSMALDENQEVVLGDHFDHYDVIPPVYAFKKDVSAPSKKTVNLITKQISTKFPTIPASQIAELISEALTVANQCDDSNSGDTSRAGIPKISGISKVTKSCMEEEVDDDGIVGNFTDILSTMKVGKSKEETKILNVDTSSVFSIDNELKKLMERGDPPEESVGYLLETRKRVENIMLSAANEGKTPKEVAELLMNLEEQRLHEEKNEEAKKVERLKKRLAEQLVQRAISAGAGKSPREIAAFLMEGEELKKTEELVAKALHECKTPTEMAEYLLKASGEEMDSWNQKTSTKANNISQKSAFQPLTLADAAEDAEYSLDGEALNDDQFSVLSMNDTGNDRSLILSMNDTIEDDGCFGDLDERMELCASDAKEAADRIFNLGERIAGVKYFVSEAKGYADEVVEIANEVKTGFMEVNDGLQFRLFGQKICVREAKENIVGKEITTHDVKRSHHNSEPTPKRAKENIVGKEITTHDVKRSHHNSEPTPKRLLRPVHKGWKLFERQKRRKKIKFMEV